MATLQELYDKNKTTLSVLSKETGFSVSTISRYVKGTVKDVNPHYENPIRKALEEMTIKNGLSESFSDVNDTPSDNVSINVDELKDQMSRNTFVKPVSHATFQRIPRKGDIFYIKNPYSTGNEMWGSRPAVCVSNSKVFDATGTMSVCYLTSKPKFELPCHVNIKTDRSISIALCESIYTVSKDRIDKYFGHITEDEMVLIENALLISLDIKHIHREKIVEVPTTVPNVQMEILKAENEMLKEFNHNLVSILAK